MVYESNERVFNLSKYRIIRPQVQLFLFFFLGSTSMDRIWYSVMPRGSKGHRCEQIPGYSLRYKLSSCLEMSKHMAVNDIVWSIFTL